MRHGVSGRKFDMPTAQRKALFRGLVRDLFIHERITTTLPRAKEVRPIAEKMITLAKHGDLNSRRKALAFVTDKDVIARLFADIAPRYATRPGGYTRIVKLGKRLGDGADVAIIELV
ncbi:MAG: 50S ribosomal protein L17 [Dehalococcoidia bacterium]